MTLADDLLALAASPELRAELEPLLGGYCHQFRNRLNSLKLGIYLAKRQGDAQLGSFWDGLDADYAVLERGLERVQAICRPTEVHRLTLDLGLMFADRRPHWTAATTARSGTIRFVPLGDPCPAYLDPARIAQALDDVILWRATVADGPYELSISWARSSTHARIVVQQASERPASASGQPVVEVDPWAMPSLVRAVADHHGTVTAGAGGGWSLELTLPDADVATTA